MATFTPEEQGYMPEASATDATVLTARKAAGRWYPGRHRHGDSYPHPTRSRRVLSPPSPGDDPRGVGASCGSLPARGRALFELSDPYLEADNVLGKLAGRARLHQLLYARLESLPLGLRYVLGAFGGYGVEIVHGDFPF
jgi:hypothetical protein